MTYRISPTERSEVIRQRLRRIEQLEAAIQAKRYGLLNQKRITGKDAARYVILSEAFSRVACLHPFHCMRYLPG